MLGCLIDSISIILLTVPVFAPVAMALGFDPIAFAILGILAIETGLLTPPFGMLVFTVKAALPQEASGRRDLPRLDSVLDRPARRLCDPDRRHSPEIATWLPNLGQDRLACATGEENRPLWRFRSKPAAAGKRTPNT